MKMRLLNVYWVMLGVLFLCGTGCAKSSIVGKWKGTVPLPAQSGAQSAPILIEYNADNTFSQSIKLPIGNMVAVGKYTIEGNRLTLNAGNAEIIGRVKLPPGRGFQPKQQFTFEVKGETLNLSVNNEKPIILTRVR